MWVQLLSAGRKKVLGLSAVLAGLSGLASAAADTAVSGVGVTMAGDVVALLICEFKVIRWFCYRLS